MKIYDIEVFEHMNLAGYFDIETGNIDIYVNADEVESQTFNHNNAVVHINTNFSHLKPENGLIGFNNKNYDDFLIDDILKSRRTDYIKTKSDTIINGKRINQYFDWWSFDVREGLQEGVSLKKWEAMRGLSVLESTIPFDYTGIFDIKMILEVVDYNIQDLHAQYELYKYRKTYFEGKNILVNEYGWSGSQRYSNTSISARYLMGNSKLAEFRPKTPSIYGVPDEACDFLNNALEASPRVSAGKTSAIREKLKKAEWSEQITANHGMVYTWGWGGLHGAIGLLGKTKTGKNKITYPAVDFENVEQWDVSSMFPNIIIRDNLLGEQTSKYQRLVVERLKNKANHNPVADAQKIVINSVYGALRLQTSRLYNPKSAIAVNVAGMVAIYNLADKLSQCGQLIQVNTDGVTFKPNPGTSDNLHMIKESFEAEFELNLEVTKYDRFIQSNVNNYIAKSGDHFKTKGGMLNQSQSYNYLSKSKPAIIDKALFEYLVNNITPRETVENGSLSDFTYILTSMRGKTQTGYTVDENGNGLSNRVNRVIATKNGIRLFKEKTNGTLQKFSDAPELMTVLNEPIDENAEFDIDYDFYIELANKKIKTWDKS